MHRDVSLCASSLKSNLRTRRIRSVSCHAHFSNKLQQRVNGPHISSRETRVHGDVADCLEQLLKRCLGRRED